MSYYVSKAPNGSAMIHPAPPTGKAYIEVETLPEGEGRLMWGEGGHLYRVPWPQPPETPEGGDLASRVAAMEEAIGRGLML